MKYKDPGTLTNQDSINGKCPAVLCVFFFSQKTSILDMGVSKNRGVLKPPKMDGENNGSKPYEKKKDLGG